MRPYDKYEYIYPPRPEEKIPVNLIGFYEKKKWVAQYKKNGTCSVIFVSPEGEVIIKTRHNTDHRGWTPSSEVMNPFKALKLTGWSVFVGELLHSKTPTIKNTMYIFDMVVYNGKRLLDLTIVERMAIVESLFPKTNVETKSHYCFNPNIWIAKFVEADLKKHFLEIRSIEDEGLVLKNPNATLSSKTWCVKARVPASNYAF